MSFAIQGLGTATPARGIAQTDATEIAQSICCATEQQSRTLTALYRRAGVRHRHSVALEPGDHHDAALANGVTGGDSASADMFAVSKRAAVAPAVTQSFYPPAWGPDDGGPTTAERMKMYEQHAALLAVEASNRALDASPFEPHDITHLVTVSCTGFSAPGLDVAVIRDCDLRPSVARVHVGFMGCHGAINGLRVAQALADADTQARVLVCAVELCTLHQQYGWQPDRIVSNALFADGAGAVVGSATADSDAWPRVIATGSTVVPDTEELMQWSIRDHGFEMTLSSQVPSVIEARLRPWLCDFLGKRGLSLGDIGGWAIHPGGPRILRACGDALELEREQLSPSFGVLSDFGNMSSPTVLFIMQRLIEQAAKRPYVMLAFGPGLTIETALIR